jgi:four helix bundle protein
MQSTGGQLAYKDLIVWQKSMDFANAVISVIEVLDTPRKHYRLFEQLEAAATSIPMNIAEGKGRNSRKEFVHFLHVSRGSFYETLTLLEIFLMRGWLTSETFQELEHQSIEIAKMLNGLINSIEKGI